MQQAAINTCVAKLPSIYLLRLGTVDALRGKLVIPKRHMDDHIVLKYGRTIDLRRRVSEHARSFRKRLPGSEVGLVYHSPVHPSLLVEAERNIEQWFKEADMYLENKTHTEIAIAPRLLVRTRLRREYERIAEQYGLWRPESP